MEAVFKRLFELTASFKNNTISFEKTRQYYIDNPKQLKSDLAAAVKPIDIFKAYLESILPCIDTIYSGFIDQYNLRNPSKGGSRTINKSRKTRKTRKSKKSRKSRKTARKY